VSGKPLEDRELVIGQGQDVDNRVLGGVLRARRKDLNRRTEDVAQALDVTASYIRSIERGQRAPAPDKAEQLLLDLGLQPERSQGGGLRFRIDGKYWILTFKHWAPDRATGTGAFLLRAVGSLAAPTGAAMALPGADAAFKGGGGWSQLRSFRERRRGVDEGASDEALMGQIIQRIARMQGEELRDVAAAVEAIHAAHAAGETASVDSGHDFLDWDDDGVVDAEIVDDAEAPDRRPEAPSTSR
jgi:transcriptional regulator with XRE-family HTH domain